MVWCWQSNQKAGKITPLYSEAYLWVEIAAMLALLSPQVFLPQSLFEAKERRQAGPHAITALKSPRQRPQKNNLYLFKNVSIETTCYTITGFGLGKAICLNCKKEVVLVFSVGNHQISKSK